MGKIRTYKNVSVASYMDRGVIVRIHEECKGKKCRYVAVMDPFLGEFSAKSLSELDEIISGELNNHPVLKWDSVISIDIYGSDIMRSHGFTGWSVESFDIANTGNSGECNRRRMWFDKNHISRTLKTLPDGCEKLHVGLISDYHIEPGHGTIVIPYSEYAMVKFDELRNSVEKLQGEFKEYAERVYRVVSRIGSEKQDIEPSKLQKTYNMLSNMSQDEVDDVYRFAVERSKQIVDGGRLARGVWHENGLK